MDNILVLAKTVFAASKVTLLVDGFFFFRYTDRWIFSFSVLHCGIFLLEELAWVQEHGIHLQNGMRCMK